MISYKCIVTGDDLFSDIYKIKTDGALYIIEGKLVRQNEDGTQSDVTIGSDQDGQNDGSTDLVVNIIAGNRLEPAAPVLTKRQYQQHLKNYVKR
ncbi:translationally-controlled tumor protein [Elysia marginata]|uniref:Translationally-controlled tumor protein n=1 Tax=Elysia marginata TaxID=1093978 RepID=A0AAV4GIC0_9GAST|nr:translationally-controlled tumor protein [Elysia marginata]